MMETTNLPPLPEPVIIPGIMELIFKNKERISLETYDLSPEEVVAYFQRARMENPIFPEDYELANRPQ
jgi:hypothetical protein